MIISQKQKTNTRKLRDKLPSLLQEDLNLLNDFKNERDLSNSTIDGYKNSVKLFNDYTKTTLQEQLTAAELEEEKGVRWKK